MNKTKLEAMATRAAELLAKKRSLLFMAAEATITAKQTLETNKAQATTGGVFDGKNAETREAQAREHLQSEYGKLGQCEKAERFAQHEYLNASADMDIVKTLLRIAELAE